MQLKLNLEQIRQSEWIVFLIGLIGTLASHVVLGRISPDAFLIIQIALASYFILIPFLLALITNKHTDWLKPIYPLSFGFLLYYPIRAYFLYLFPQKGQALVFPSLNPFSPELFSESLIMATIGWLSIFLAFQIIERSAQHFRWKFFKKQPASKTLEWKIVFLFGIGAVSIAWLYINGDSPPWIRNYGVFAKFGGVIDYILLFPFYAFALSLIFLRNTSRFYTLQNFIFGAALILYGLFLGNKVIIISTLLIVLYAISYSSPARLPLKKIALIVVISFLLVFPVATIYRSAFEQTNHTSINSINNTISASGINQVEQSLPNQSAIRSALNRFTGNFGFNIARSTLNRFIGIDSLTAARLITPREIPYQHGETYIAIITTLVPRFIWPDKPITTTCGWFASHYKKQSGGGVNCTAMTLTAEGYINFDLPGVILANMIYGALLSFLYITLVGNKKPHGLNTFLFIFLIINLYSFEQNAATLIGRTIKSLPVLLAIAYFVSPHKSKPIEKIKALLSFIPFKN